MAVIKSGATSDQLTIDPTSNAARTTLYDSTGREVWPGGPHFIVTGGTSAAVAASLAANTTLMAMRNGAGTTVYINRLRLALSAVTVGTSGLVPGMIAWQLFTTATPTGGTARTVAKKNSASAGSGIADVRDNNAALTVTGVNFTSVFAQKHVPIMTAGLSDIWEIYMDTNDAIVLQPNEGICLRTQTVMPATQTWGLSYCIEWHEE